MDENTPELTGGEVNKPLAATTEPTKSETVISPADKFRDKLASLRGQTHSTDRKPLTEASSDESVDVQVVGDKVVEAENKNVKPKHEKPRNDSQGRINGLVRNIHDRDARIKQLEAELAAFSATPKNRDDFSNDAEYIADISTSKAEETAIKREHARETQQRQQDEIQMYREKVAIQVENPERYHERAQKYVQNIDPMTEEYVLRSDIGYKMLDVIMDKFENTPGAYDEYMRMPSAKRSMLLVNLETQLANKAPNDTKPTIPDVVSKAPQSIAPTRGEKLSAPTDTRSRFTAKLNNIRAGYRP